MSLVSIPREPLSAPPTFALFELGFRGFYLAGAAWAVAAIALWMLALAGWVAFSSFTPAWHAHEMLFGFAAAIIAGFALTAVRNWTSRPTPTGWPLALLLALWTLGRIAMFYPPSWLSASLDLAFLPMLAIVLWRPILAARQFKNLFLPVILLVLAFLNLGFHASRLGLCAAPILDSLLPALYLIVLLECIIAGRVIPGFTANAINAVLPRGDQLDRVTVTVTLLTFLVAAIHRLPSYVAALSLLTAGLHLVRLARWRPWSVRHCPILWILHLSYAWIPIGLGLLALNALGLVPQTAAAHAFAVGATGGLIAAMTTRSARGHTARDLSTSAAELCMYTLIPLAALARVCAALGLQTWPLLIFSASAWMIAFALFLLRYTPWLLRPRLDGARG